jgi:hypothetical protein
VSLYATSKYPVSDDIAAVHAAQFGQLGEPGTWWTGAQRLAIVTEARAAAISAGLLEDPLDGNAPSEADLLSADLPDFVRGVIQSLAVSPQDIDYAFYQNALKDGLSDAEYVEIVGLVARMTTFDVFARGIGVALAPLPAAQTGEPSRARPAVAVQELAWVPTIPLGEDGGDFAKTLYKNRPLPYIFRGMSLVPGETEAHMELEHVQYLPMSKVLIADYQHHDGLSRAQAELVAARISALNECFY